MAKYEDSAAGWHIYRQHGGEIALEELNQLLQARGFRPVAKRSMAHYRKLQRLGYEEYVSMNRLDIKHASDAVFDITDRSRYEDQETAIEANLYLPTAQQFEVLEIEGILTRMSEGFATLRMAEPTDKAIRATRSSKYNRGVLRFTATGFERAVQVAEAIEFEGSVEILLTFRSLLSADMLFPERVGAVSRSRLTVELSDDPTLHAVVTAIHRSFDLFESLRGFVETVLTEIPEDQRPILPAPRVERLSTGSPLVQDLIGDPVVWILVGFIVKWVLARIKDTTEIDGNLQQIRIRDDQNERAEERHRVEVKAMQLSSLKAELEIRSLLRSVEKELLDKYGIELDRISQTKEDRLESLKDQAIEAAAELASESSDLEFEAIEDDEDEEARG